MASYNRKTARARLVVHFNADLIGTGLPFQAIYSHDARNFRGQSPVLCVVPGGIARSPFGQGVTVPWMNRIPMILLTYVSTEVQTGYTLADVADILDDCEVAIADSVKSHRKDLPYWNNLFFDDEVSAIVSTTIGGAPYRLEISQVWAEVQDND